MSNQPIESNMGEIDYGSNPELAAAFGGKQPGDKCKFMTEASTVTNEDGKIRFRIDVIEPDEEYTEGEPMVSVPTGDEPVTMLLQSEGNEDFIE